MCIRDRLKDLRKQGRAFIGACADDFFVFAVQPLFHSFQAGQLLHAQHIGGQQIVKRGPLPRHSQLFHPAQQGGSLVQPFLCIGIFFQHGIFCLFPGRGRFLFLGIGQLLLPVARAVGQRGAEQFSCCPGTAGSFEMCIRDRDRSIGVPLLSSAPLFASATVGAVRPSTLLT